MNLSLMSFRKLNADKLYRNAPENGNDTPDIRAPYTEIPGIDKPVSRIFFGTAIAPMLAGSTGRPLRTSRFGMCS